MSSTTDGLLRLALTAMDSIPATKPSWSLGGSASLAIELEHRDVVEIDIHLDSASAIRALVPALNPVTKNICSDYSYVGHALTLAIPELGRLNFVARAPLLEDPTVPYEFDGRVIDREWPAEVIAKRIYHHAGVFTAEDVFDLAVVYAVKPSEMASAGANPFLDLDVLARLRLRLDLLESQKSMPGEAVKPTLFGRQIIENSYLLARTALEVMEDIKPAASVSDAGMPK